MEITTSYPWHAKPICWISIGFDRGRFVISPKRDITASHPDSYTVGAKNKLSSGCDCIPSRIRSDLSRKILLPPNRTTIFVDIYIYRGFLLYNTAIPSRRVRTNPRATTLLPQRRTFRLFRL